MANYKKIGDTIAFHIGYYIENCLGMVAMSTKEFAKWMNMNEDEVVAIINGDNKEPLSDDILTKLSNVIGGSKVFWGGIQEMWYNKTGAKKREG